MKRLIVSVILILSLCNLNAQTTYNLWTTTPTGTPTGEDSLLLGFTITALTDGYITGVRFYKAAASTGRHIGYAWTVDSTTSAPEILQGTLLEKKSFTNETASGWQDLIFNTPIAIASGKSIAVGVFMGAPLALYPTYPANIPSASYTNASNTLKIGKQRAGYAYSPPDGGFPYSMGQVANNVEQTWLDVIFQTELGGGVNQNPTVNAGADQSITLPTSSVSLSGSATDPDGTISSYLWTKQLGAQSTDTVDLFLIFGDSNAGGQGLNSSATGTEVAPRSLVKMFNNTTKTFQDLDIGTNNHIGQNQSGTEGLHGLELGLANEAYTSGFPLRTPVYVVKAGASGADSKEYLPYSGNGAEYFPALKERMDSAVAQITRAGLKYRLNVWGTLGLNDYYNCPTCTWGGLKSNLDSLKREIRRLYDDKAVVVWQNQEPGFPWNTLYDSLAIGDDRVFITNVSPYTSHYDYAALKVLANKNMQHILNYRARLGTSASITVSNLLAGTYTFRLTATDNNGGSGYDELTVTVSPSGTTSSNFNFSRLPYSDDDIVAPFRGFNHWNRTPGQPFSLSDNSVPLPHIYAKDAYNRYYWHLIETSQGNYDFSQFDGHIKAAIDNKMKLGFGLMPMELGSGPNVGGANLAYPAYVHTLMQAESVNSRDWIYSGGWIPNWNSTNYLTAWRNLLNATANFLNNTYYKGVKYADAISYQDIRGFGNWGEWHIYPWYDAVPTGREITSLTLNTIIDDYKSAFPNMQLVSLVGAYSDVPSSTTPPATTYKLLTDQNNFGRFGWRWDSWGQTIYGNILEDNTGSYNGVNFDTATVNVYKYAPVLGEPSSWLAGVNNFGANSAYYAFGGTPVGATSGQIEFYHASSMGNGNYDNVSDAAMRSNIIAASKKMGYRIILTSGSMTSSLTQGLPLTINTTWKNIGIAPVYERWNVMWQLRNASTGAVAWEQESNHQLRLWYKADTSATNVSDVYTLPANVPVGTYSLHLIIKDSLNYRDPLPLALLTPARQTDGSYIVKTGIPVTVGGTINQSPSANAGVDSTTTLPKNTVNLIGSGTDPDGTIAAYLWTKVSGPTAGIVSPNNSTTLLDNLLEGEYVFRLTVTDNNGATGSDDVNVTVLQSPVGVPPTANAGGNIPVRLPATSTILYGNNSYAPPGATITGYSWAKISGPSGSILVSPTSAVTNLTNLVQGQYVYRLTVTASNSLTGTSDATITVLPSIPRKKRIFIRHN